MFTYKCTPDVAKEISTALAFAVIRSERLGQANLVELDVFIEVYESFKSQLDKKYPNWLKTSKTVQDIIDKRKAKIKEYDLKASVAINNVLNKAFGFR